MGHLFDYEGKSALDAVEHSLAQLQQEKTLSLSRFVEISRELQRAFSLGLRDVEKKRLISLLRHLADMPTDVILGSSTGFLDEPAKTASAILDLFLFSFRSDVLVIAALGTNSDFKVYVASFDLLLSRLLNSPIIRSISTILQMLVVFATSNESVLRWHCDSAMIRADSFLGDNLLLKYENLSHIEESSTDPLGVMSGIQGRRDDGFVAGYLRAKWTKESRSTGDVSTTVEAQKGLDYLNLLDSARQDISARFGSLIVQKDSFLGGVAKSLMFGAQDRKLAEQKEIYDLTKLMFDLSVITRSGTYESGRHYLHGYASYLTSWRQCLSGKKAFDGYYKALEDGFDPVITLIHLCSAMEFFNKKEEALQLLRSWVPRLGWFENTSIDNQPHGFGQIYIRLGGDIRQLGFSKDVPEYVEKARKNDEALNAKIDQLRRESSERSEKELESNGILALEELVGQLSTSDVNLALEGRSDVGGKEIKRDPGWFVKRRLDETRLFSKNPPEALERLVTEGLPAVQVATICLRAFEEIERNQVVDWQDGVKKFPSLFRAGGFGTKLVIENYRRRSVQNGRGYFAWLCKNKVLAGKDVERLFAHLNASIEKAGEDNEIAQLGEVLLPLLSPDEGKSIKDLTKAALRRQLGATKALSGKRSLLERLLVIDSGDTEAEKELRVVRLKQKKRMLIGVGIGIGLAAALGVVAWVNAGKTENVTPKADGTETLAKRNSEGTLKNMVPPITATSGAAQGGDVNSKPLDRLPKGEVPASGSVAAGSGEAEGNSGNATATVQPPLGRVSTSHPSGVYEAWWLSVPAGSGRKLDPREVSSSSEMRNHPAVHAFDGTHKTAWNESARGQGEGEWIEAVFSSPQRFRYIRLATGYSAISDKWGDLFVRNAHIKKLKVTFDGGSKKIVDVGEQEREVELRDFDLTASRVRFKILEVYPGADWADLCMSEIELWGEVQAEPASNMAPESTNSLGPGESAMRAYRAQISAYNAKNAEAYFAAYAPTLECFYNKANYDLKEIRGRRTKLVSSSSEHHWTIRELTVLSENPTRVVLRDQSTDVWSTGSLSDDRRLVLVNLNGGWRLTIEVGKTAHRCYPEY